MRFIGRGGKMVGTPAVPQGDTRSPLVSKEDILISILGRAFRDYPILVANVEPKDVMDGYLARVIDILASVVANPSPTEPEVLPRFLGFSIYTITEPRHTDRWGVLDEVDRLIGGEVKALYPKLTLKAYPTEDERRRLAIFGRGNQEILSVLSSEVHKILSPDLFGECVSIAGDSEEADYFLLVELSMEELANSGVIGDSTLQSLAKHLERETELFTNHGVRAPEGSRNDGRRN